MKGETSKIIRRYTESNRCKKWTDLCLKVTGQNSQHAKIILCILLIETSYRKLWFRIGEYIFTLVRGGISIFFGKELKNYTIGKCQLGLVDILNYYGDCKYRHSPNVKISSWKQLEHLLSVIFLQRSLQILYHELTPMLATAKKMYHMDIYKSLVYIGCQFNGRYAYGQLLCNVYRHVFLHGIS